MLDVGVMQLDKKRRSEAELAQIRINELQKENVDLKVQIRRITEKCNDFEAVNDGLKRDVAGLQATIAQRDQSIADKDVDLEKLLKSSDSRGDRAKVAQLDDQLQNLERDYQKLRLDLVRAKEDLVEKEVLVQNVTTEKVQLDAEKQMADLRIKTLQTKLDRAIDDQQRAEQTNAQIMDEKAKLVARLNELSFDS